MKRNSPEGPRKGGLGPLAGTLLSLMTAASVVFLLILAVTGSPRSVVVQAQEKPAPALAPIGSPGGSAPTPSSSAPRSGHLAIRLATWNVRDCAAWDEAAKTRIPLHDYVARTIKEARVDVVVLEEIQSDEGKGGDIALLSVALAREGWAMPYLAVVNARGEDDLAVFSRYRIAESGPVIEPAKGDPWPRQGIFASIDTGTGQLDVYGFHFKAMGDAGAEEARRAQAKAVGDHIMSVYGDSLPARAVVMAGDFNTANASDLLERNSTLSALRLADDASGENDFLDANYRFRRAEPTFVDDRYSSVLDHILLSPLLSVGMDGNRVEIRRPVPGPGKIPTSDHRMVLTEFNLSPAR